MDDALTLLAITGPSQSACGYCHSGHETSHSFGAWAFTASPNTYQSMINRNWRRSGKYLYRPSHAQSCCPAYTVRLGVNGFGVSKGQRKVMRKMRRFLEDGHGIDGDDTGNDTGNHTGDAPVSDLVAPNINPACFQSPIGHVIASTPHNPQHTHSGTGLAQSTEKQTKSTQTGKKSFVELMDDAIRPLPTHKHVLKIVTVPASFEQESFEVYKQYQTTIHNDSPDKLTKSQYTNFLVDTPLRSITSKPSHIDPTETITFGTVHQKYYIDDKLVAVAVLDILPRCVSSVYLFYLPEYSQLSLGTFSALYEIAFTARIQRLFPQIEYYYLGFYIHSCPKMRYKGGYRPSDLLCGQTYQWVPLHDAVKLLDMAPSTPLSTGEIDATTGLAKCLDTPTSFHPSADYAVGASSRVPDTYVYYNAKVVPALVVAKSKPDWIDSINRICALLDPKCVTDIAFVF